MALAMGHFLRAYPLETLQPGDVLITNDPWQTSGHLNDVTICSPVYRGDECVAFFASTCHTADIGGHVLSAEAREVYEEGLQIPIMKLYEAGRPNESLFKILRANVRLPEMVLGDFHAQMAGGAVGGERLLEFMDEFSMARLEPLADEIIGRTERAMREAIRGLRPGAYTHEVTSDGFDEPITIRVRCEVRGDELFIDYAGSSPASRRGVNVVMNYTEAYTTYGVKVIVSPDVPNNEGAFRPLRITAPEGSILNVKRPAAVAARHVIGHFLPHVIAGALGQALPDRVMAEGSANIWGIQVSGKDLADQPFSYVFFASGGTGARAIKDGLSATAFPSGVLGTPAEVIENLSPLMIEKKELRGGSGGVGRYRGGLGQTIAFRVQQPRARRVLDPRRPHPAPRPGLPGRRPRWSRRGVDRWGGAVEPEGRTARAAGRPRRGATARRGWLRSHQRSATATSSRPICARATSSRPSPRRPTAVRQAPLTVARTRGIDRLVEGSPRRAAELMMAARRR